MSASGADWRAWYDAHGAALLLFARQWCDTQADAEDIVQEAFIRFWKTRGRGAVREPLAYLFMCVKRVAMDQRRSRQRRRRRETQVVAQTTDAALFQSGVEHDERRQLIEAALATLAGEQRQVVVLKLWGGLTFAQVAEALEIPANTAASRYRYALEALRRQLSEEMAP